MIIPECHFYMPKKEDWGRRKEMKTGDTSIYIPTRQTRQKTEKEREKERKKENKMKQVNKEWLKEINREGERRKKERQNKERIKESTNAKKKRIKKSAYTQAGWQFTGHKIGLWPVVIFAFGMRKGPCNIVRNILVTNTQGLSTINFWI